MRVYRSENLIKDDASLHIFEQVVEKPMPVHVHDFIEIIYVTGGTAEQNINGACYNVKRGDLLFINYGSTHAFVPHGSFSYINICFKPEVLSADVITPENAFAVLQLTAFEEIRRASDEDGVVSYVGEERAEIEHVVRAMLREYIGQKHGWHTVIKSYMSILIAHIVRRLVGNGEDAPSGVWQELTRYIDDNPTADLSLDALAGKCFYNPSYFSRAFKKQFGMSLTEYLNHRRIERAMRLASETEWHDEQIAQAVGFSYKSSFLRVFRRMTGKTFAQFKKESQQK